MGLAVTNLTITAIRAALGATDWALSLLCKHSNVNVWSYYKPCAMQANGGTLLLEKATDVAPHNQGEFRGYNHAAVAPNLQTPNPTLTYYGSSDLSGVVFQVNNNEANLKELSSDITHLMFKFYTNAGRTNIITLGSGLTYILVPITFYDITSSGFGAIPAWPLNYKLNTNGKWAPQTSTNNSGAPITFPNAGIPLVNNMVIYGTVWYSNGAAAALAKIPSGSDFSFIAHQAQQPTVTLQTGSWTPNPLWDSNSSHSATGIAPQVQSMVAVAGQTSWNFSFKPQAVYSSGTPALCDIAGNVQVAYNWPIGSGSYVNIGGSRSISYGATISVTDAISGGATQLDYDQAHVIRLTFSSLTNNTDVV